MESRNPLVSSGIEREQPGATCARASFGLLGIIISIEAIFITGVLLISQNRQSAHFDKGAELDYEVNVRTYREIHQIDAMLSAIMERLQPLGTTVRERQT